MPDIPVVSVYPQTFLKVGTLYHGTDGAIEAPGSEGSCPGCPGSLWYLDNQIIQAPELLWFPKLSRRGQPKAAAESEGGYQVARGSRGRREKDRNGEREKHPLQSGLWVSELHDERGLERGTDR